MILIKFSFEKVQEIKSGYERLKRENLLSVSSVSIVTSHSRRRRGHTTHFQLIMQLNSYIIILLLSLISIIQSSSATLNSVGKCLSDLATQEFSNSYNYLQLSSKFGTKNAYPGFSSFFIKLSDDDASKAHHIAKFLALRKIKLDRLINVNGVRIRTKTSDIFNVNDTLTEGRNQNTEAWKIVHRCHEEAAKVIDANIQDYLEANLLNHHIKIDKLFSDFQNRITDPEKFDKELTIFMLDEELLDTYGDHRKDIFS